jgi:hypothetical protein
LKEGSLVVVIAALDKRIREKQTQGLVKGTLYQLSGDHVIVILEDMDLYIGIKRDIRDLGEQE